MVKNHDQFLILILNIDVDQAFLSKTRPTGREVSSPPPAQYWICDRLNAFFPLYVWHANDRLRCRACLCVFRLKYIRRSVSDLFESISEKSDRHEDVNENIAATKQPL